MKDMIVSVLRPIKAIRLRYTQNKIGVFNGSQTYGLCVSASSKDFSNP